MLRVQRHYSKRKVASMLLVTTLFLGVFINLLSLPLPVRAAIYDPLMGCAVDYGTASLNSTEIATLGADYGMLICWFTMGTSSINSVKAINPDFKALGYRDAIRSMPGEDDYATVNANEDWFLHDVYNNRIAFPSGGYLMDPSSAGWRQHLVDYINAKFAAYTAFDGVLLDDFWDQISTYIGWGNFAGVSFNSGDVTNWHTDMMGLVNYINTYASTGKLVIINTNEYLTDDYVTYCDGRVDESFVSKNWETMQYRIDNAAWMDFLGHIDAMERDTSAGKIVIAVDGADDFYTNPSDVADFRDWCYAASLLGCTSGSNSYSIFQNSGYAASSYTYDSTTGYYPTLLNVGLPDGSYYADQSVYIRDFTLGKVVFNPSATPHNSIALGGTYILNDVEVTTVDVPAYGGVVVYSDSPTYSVSQTVYSSANSVVAFSDTFETGDTSEWTTVTETQPTVSDTQKYAGTYSLHFPALTGGGSTDYYVLKTLGSSSASMNITAYVYFVSLPASGNANTLIGAQATSTVAVADVYNNGGTMQFRLENMVNAASFDGTYSISTGQWYKLNFLIAINGASGSLKLYVDDVLTVDSGDTNLGTSDIAKVFIEDYQRLGSGDCAEFYVDNFSAGTVGGTYELTISISSPSNSTYSSSTVAYSVTNSGNETGVTYQINAYNEGSPVGANETSATGSFTSLSDGSYMFAVRAIGDNSFVNYLTVYFTVDVAAYSVSLTVTNPKNITYSTNAISYSLSTSGTETDLTYQVNVYNSTGSAVGSNKTAASGSFLNLVNGSYTFAAYVEGSHSASDYETVAFSVYSTSLISYITVSPSSSIIVVGETQTYTVMAYDMYGRLIDDVTTSASFSLTTYAGGSWSDSTYTTEVEGSYVVTASYGGYSTYANLIVIDLDTEAVMQLPFDNDVGSTCFDWSGHGNTGTISGASRNYGGYYGMGLTFDGNDYVYVADDSSLDLTSYAYMSAWIRPSEITESIIMEKTNSYGLYLRAGGGVSLMVNDVFYNLTDDNVIQADNAYLIVGIHNSLLTSIYVNGTGSSLSNPDVAIVPSAYELVIGDNFVGDMDEVNIYNASSVNSGNPSAYYPYCYTFGVTSSSNWLIQKATYHFTGVYVTRSQEYSYLFNQVAFSFTDGESTLGLQWQSSTGTLPGTYTQMTGGDKIIFKTQSASISGNSLTLSSLIEIENNIASSINTGVTMNCTILTGSFNARYVPNLFNIYGVGSSSMVNIAGDAAQVAGGSIFDVMAQNSSATGSGSQITVSTLIPKFQHFHTLVTLYQGALWVDDVDVWDSPTYCFNTGYLEYGVNYLDPNSNATMEGWYVKLEVVNGAAGDYNESKNADAWVQLNCTWYNNGEYIKSDTIFCGYEAYRENDTTTQFSVYVDLWLSNQNANTMVGGSVTAQYYGLTENGWWLWSNWGPVDGLQTSSTFYDYLYNSDDEIISASSLEIFNVWTSLAKTGIGDGPTSDDEHVWATTCRSLQFFSLPIGQTLVGINTPIFNPTTTPDMPVGLFAEMANMLANAISSLQYYMSTFISSAAGVTASAINTAFEAVGVSSAVTDITGFASSIGAYFSDSVTYISNLLYTIFSLFTSIANFLIEWFGGFITAIIDIGNGVVSLLTTGSINGIPLLETFNLAVIAETLSEISVELITTGALFIFIAIWWFDSIDKRAKQYGGGWMSFFMSDVQNIISVFSFIIDLAWRVVSTVIDLSMRFFNILV